MIAALAARLAPLGLEVLGVAPEGAGSVVLIGPDDRRFWLVFRASPEARDGAPDPLDRWSKRVIGGLAATFGGRAVFPSDGPPWPAFTRWALDSGRCRVSPVGMLVHDKAGLWVSFRGALIVPERLAARVNARAPCDDCPARPCLSACPAGALGPGGLDAAACHRWLDQGGDCMARGCAARRACPAGRLRGRVEAQSAFHMKAFHP